jgi:hypothetical protein
MKRIGKGLILTICIVGLLALFGCSMVQDIATLCHIDETAVEYSETTKTSYLPWTTVYDAKRVLAHINYKHQQLQLAYERMKVDDNLRHAFLTGNLELNIADAVAFQQKVFNPAGPIGLGLTTLFGGTIGALFINTPKKKKEEN